ncbi:hypothetical protein [Streptomyces sp. RerS4]|uniref:hypothetical protein n=1 Tax=Streptomyces sp. RerS4 TaxID=2942449 RepID=UPI00201BB609|nr:hypothetical protein [Streptomyces sp. RerS4]UQX04691.1 hypothetical protein M4D82_32410 [Streptomyces sp. RerS4]
MLGWSISIYFPTPEQVQDLKSPKDHDQAQNLAYWTTRESVGWLTDLERQGKAKEIISSGYPWRFTALAGDVLPLLADAAKLGIGVHPFTGGAWVADEIADCPADELLIIDAWDQS